MSTDRIYNCPSDSIPFKVLDKDLESEIIKNQDGGWKSPYACKDVNVVRREDRKHDKSTLLRSAFDRDIEKIIYLPAFNRYNDKTQVFSFLRNDDVSRRGLHVQCVSKIARNIGTILGLNTKLIEAISIGHDIGHTPFGHAGEKYLNEVFYERTKRSFTHNLHSVRVLDYLYKRNLSLQTLDGILCHNGEIAKQRLDYLKMKGFAEFDKKVESCYEDINNNLKIKPCTLEACVVRISDIIAYLGKDRIDALQIGVIDNITCFDSKVLGRENTKIINNATIDLIENSYGKDHLEFSEEMYKDILVAKKQNYQLIYDKEGMCYDNKIHLDSMITKMYEHFYDDIVNKNSKSTIFKHHILSLLKNSSQFDVAEYISQDPNQIVVDYLASMTDSYFLFVYKNLFPDDKLDINFRGYFQA